MIYRDKNIINGVIALEKAKTRNNFPEQTLRHEIIALQKAETPSHNSNSTLHLQLYKPRKQKLAWYYTITNTHDTISGTAQVYGGQHDHNTHYRIATQVHVDTTIELLRDWLNISGRDSEQASNLLKMAKPTN